MTDIEMNVTVGEGGRRLPVYLLLDCSSSMSGARIEAVRLGVDQFAQEAKTDIYAKETVHVGVITFDSGARMVTSGLVPIGDFLAPQISANGSTSLGQAFRVLQQSLDTDLKPSVKGKPKGDYKPLIFILTDGAPTDEWEVPRKEIEQRQTAKVINVITVGCGSGINLQTLKDIAIGPTFLMDDEAASFKKFFQWISQTVQYVSQSFQAGEHNQPVTMVNPDPNVFQYIP